MAVELSAAAPAPTLGGDRLDAWLTSRLAPAFDAAARRWLAGLNSLLGLALAGAFLAPGLQALGLRSAADAIYDAYLAACHQWAFRSFFALGQDATYSRGQLEAMGADPFRFSGSSALGWKLALCERDLAILVGLFAFGLLYGTRWRRRGLQPIGYLTYGALSAPMAIDALTQLPGWRESSWEQRVVTGLLFGVASAWLLYPRFQGSLDESEQA